MTDTPHGAVPSPVPQWSAPGSPSTPPHAPGLAHPPGLPPQDTPSPGVSSQGSSLQHPGAPQPHWSAALTAHKPGIIPLRPLGFGDILEGSFAAIRRNPRTLFGLALLTSLTVVGLIAVCAAVFYLVATQIGSGGVSDALLAVGTVGGLTLVWAVGGIVSVALTGMIAYPVGEGVLGRRPTLGETWRRTRRALLRLAGLCLTLMVPAVVVFGGLLALFVWALSSNSGQGSFLAGIALLACSLGFVFVAIRLSLATPALVLEDIRVMASLRRSWQLTLGRFWRVVGVLVVTSIIVGVVQQVLAFGFQLVGTLIGFAVTTTADESVGSAFMVIALGASIVGSLVAGVLTQPFVAAVTALLYVDARIRREGFDLALVRAASGARVTG